MVHEGNKPFQCSTCDYKCSSKSSLDKHVRCVHEKKKLHNCAICEKSFFTKVAVNRHTLAVHEKQKNFDCHLCNLSFSIKCNLKRHVLSVHEKVKVKKSIKKESKLIDQVLIQNWVQIYRNWNLRSENVHVCSKRCSFWPQTKIHFYCIILLLVQNNSLARKT